MDGTPRNAGEIELPKGTVVYRKTGPIVGSFVVERPPGPRSIITKKGHRFLSFPYLYFAVEFSWYGSFYSLYKLKVCSSPCRVRSPSNEIWLPPLTNLYLDGQVCMGETFFTTAGQPAQIAQAAIDHFWSSQFGHFPVYDEWARRTGWDPRWAELEWPTTVLGPYFEEVWRRILQKPVSTFGEFTGCCKEDFFEQNH